MFLETLVGSSKLLPIIWRDLNNTSHLQKIPSKFPPAKTHRPKKNGLGFHHIPKQIPNQPRSISVIAKSHLRCWCGVQWSKEGGIPFATLPFDRTGTVVVEWGFRSRLKCKTQHPGKPNSFFFTKRWVIKQLFSPLFFRDFFGSLFFLPWKVWDPGNLGR